MIAPIARRQHPLLGKIAATELDPTGGRRDQPEDHADRRTLAGAIRSEEPVNLACAHLEIEPIDGDDRAEPFCQSDCTEKHGMRRGPRLLERR
jgi:hypothetical protein